MHARAYIAWQFAINAGAARKIVALTSANRLQALMCFCCRAAAHQELAVALANSHRLIPIHLGVAKKSQRALMISLHAKHQHFLDHCGRSILYAFFVGRIENMVIATLLFLAFIVATGAGIVKAYEWHQDVLYGPYLKRID